MDPYGIVRNLVFESTYKTLHFYARKTQSKQIHTNFAFNTDLIEQRTGMYIKLPINNDNQI